LPRTKLGYNFWCAGHCEQAEGRRGNLRPNNQ